MVVACHSASCTVLHEDKVRNVPLFNVIAPAVDAALKATRNNKIGLLATRATVTSGSYGSYLRAKSATAELYAQAASLLVPFVEEGWFDDPVTDLVLHRHIQPLLENNIDTLILGCTHFPLLKNAIQNICGPQIQLIDPAESLIHQLAPALAISSTVNTTAANGRLTVLTTDLSASLQELAHKILFPLEADRFEVVQIQPFK